MLGEQRDALVAQAVAAFSDACTIPVLTPSCPFYRLDQSFGATCGEECREFLESTNFGRPTQTIDVLPGLRMTGAARPIAAATGHSSFDATEIMLTEMNVPNHAASTTTLFLRLRREAITPPWTRTNHNSHESFYGVWTELVRRGISAEGVLRVGAAPAIAQEILRLVQAEDSSVTGWISVYAGCREEAGDEEQYNRWFTSHVTEWFARLVESNLESFLAWEVPQPALLVHLPHPQPDEGAQWLWDRFTITALEDWKTTSLVAEWDYSGGKQPDSCPRRVLAVRELDATKVTETVLERLSNRPGLEARRDLSTEQFVNRAAQLLQTGDPAAAAEIFTALVYVNPADGDALNNLGFCLIPTSAVQAIGPLDRAARFPLKNKTLNAANRAFVRHLLGKNQESLEILRSCEPDESPVLVWTEQRCGSFHLEKQPLDDYVDQLIDHISIAPTGPTT